MAYKWSKADEEEFEDRGNRAGIIAAGGIPMRKPLMLRYCESCDEEIQVPHEQFLCPVCGDFTRKVYG